MHKSKLAGFIIDCQTTDLPRAAQFWGNALGLAVGARCVVHATSKDFDAKASQWP